MKTTTIHIGSQIWSVMREKDITKAELARLLEVKPQSVDYLLKRKSVDTDTLFAISTVLNFDFFKLYHLNQPHSEQINFDIDPSKAKIVVELTLSMEDMARLNLKDRIVNGVY